MNIPNMLMAISITSDQVSSIIDPILVVFDKFLFPVVLAIVVLVGVPTILSKIIKVARAEDENQAAAAKKSLVNSIICFIGVFAVIVILDLALPVLTEWLTDISLVDEVIGDVTLLTE